MEEFMRVNYTSPDKLFEFKNCYSCPSWDRKNGELSYDHGKISLGFDYGSCCDPERHYVHAILRWMALKVGKLRMFKGIGSIPYTVYDGYEATPIITGVSRKEIPEKYRWALYDRYGYYGLGCVSGVPDSKRNARDWVSPLRMFYFALAVLMGGEQNLKKYDKLMKDELKRLDKLWKGI